MRSLEKRASHRFYAAWLVAALAAALACMPAFAFAEESESAGTGADGGAIAAEETFDEIGAEVVESTSDAPEAVVLEQDGSDGSSNSDGTDEEVGADDPSDGTDESQPEGPNDSVKPVEPIVPGLKTVGDRFQYVNDDGTLVKSDWKTVGDKRYYFDESGNSVRGSQKIDGSWYCFDSKCAMQTGWVVWDDGLRSYFDGSGRALTGWQRSGGHWYYFSPSTGKSVRWSQKIGGKWYYFNGASQMHTGWLQWSGKQQWSFYWNDGSRASGKQTIGGYDYIFDSDGRTSTPPVTRSSAELAMERKAQGYSSSTNYMILVNRSTHKLGIFERKSGRWDMIAYWDCVTGAPSTPTITGSFKTTGGKRSSLSTDSRAKYCTQITGGYFFHTILASNNELGKSLSHGCVRLSYSSAKWIYQHVRAGTRVVIY